jgi:hypothetical protein
MTDDKTTLQIVEHLMAIYLDRFRTLARLKALEAMVETTLIPESKIDGWHEQLNLQTKRNLQELLEKLEKDNPTVAALVDQRAASELDELE